VQAQVEEIYFIFNLEYMYATLSREMLHKLSTKSHAQQKPKYPSEMSEIQWPHTPYLTEPGKIRWSGFPTPHGDDLVICEKT
jgi:hypothetical protein